MAHDDRSALNRELHPLPLGWSWRWLDDVMEIQGGAQPPASTFVSAPRPGYVRFVQIRDFDGDHHVTYIKDSDKWRKCKPNDVLIARYGAALGRILRGLEGAYNVALARVIPKGIGLEYLFYVLKSRYFQTPLVASGGRSAQSGFNKGDLRVIPVPVPPDSEQSDIADVLGKLDDKIDLNRQMNDTLEAVVHAIFKSWFVDFDPVRDRAAGRQPKGMSADIATLFPLGFYDTKLGLLPKGWRVGSVLQLARLLSGGTPKTNRPEYWTGDIRWASAKDVSQSSQSILVDTERTITMRGLQESATQLIPAWCTVVVARGATTGRMVLFGREMAMNQTCYGLESSTNTPLALYCLLRSEIGNLVHAAHGSVFDTITTSTFENSQVVIPPAELLFAFESVARPLFQLMLSNTNESRTLANLRDILLPKLLSGEVRVAGNHGAESEKRLRTAEVAL